MDPKHPAPPPRAEESSAWHALVDGQLTPAQAQALRVRKQTNRQATQEARDIAKHGGPGHASVQAMLAAMEHETHQDEA